MWAKAYQSSFCRRANGFPPPPPEMGTDPPIGPGAAPPPPRKGFAIRPKFSGDDAAAFWAVEITELVFNEPQYVGRNIHTACLVKSLLDGLQLCLKLLVLDGQPAVCVLQHCLQILYPLVTSEQLAFGDASLLLESRVLVNELHKEGEE